MAFPKRLGELCTPSMVYFIISMVALLAVILQNIGNNDRFHLGNFNCRVPSTIALLIAKVIYILFWTWILNLICKDGYPMISWLLVLLPFISIFILMGIIMMNK